MLFSFDEHGEGALYEQPETEVDFRLQGRLYARFAEVHRCLRRAFETHPRSEFAHERRGQAVARAVYVGVEIVVHLEGYLSARHGRRPAAAVRLYAGEQHALVALVAEYVEDHAGVFAVGLERHFEPREHTAFGEVGHDYIGEAAELYHLVAVRLVEYLVKRAVLRHGGIDGDERSARFEVARDLHGRFGYAHGTEKAGVEDIEVYAELLPMRVRGEHVVIKIGVGETFDAVGLGGEERGGEPDRVVSASREHGERRRERAPAHGRVVLNGQNTLVHDAIVAPRARAFKGNFRPFCGFFARRKMQLHLGRLNAILFELR